MKKVALFACAPLVSNAYIKVGAGLVNTPVVGQSAGDKVFDFEKDSNPDRVTSLYMGPNREAVRFIFDTALDYTIVEGHECTNCWPGMTPSHYDYTDEETNGDFVRTSLTQSTRQFLDNKSYVFGFEATDKIWLSDQPSPDTSVTTPLFVVTE